MSELSLSYTTDPEAAESAVRAALAAKDEPLTVKLNGFPGKAFRVIVDRLPGRYLAHHTSPNVWHIGTHEATAGGFTISELSGRFDRANPAVAHAWNVERAAGSSILLGTELAHRPDSVIAGNAYGLVHGKGAQGETAIEYAKADWKLLASRVVKVYDGGGQGRFAHPAYARAVVLEDRDTGKRLLVIQNHNKAHLFPGSKFYDPRNVHAWLVGMRRQAAAVHQLRAEFHTSAEVVSGDFNASGPWLARQMARILPGFRPGRGYEFGNAWVRGLRVGRGQTVNAGGSSDHAIKRLRFHW